MDENHLKAKANESFAIYHDLIIKAPLSKVFEAISDPVHLVKWWPLKCTGNTDVGAEYNFFFGPQYDWYGEVIQYVPDSAFHIKMTKSDIDWNVTSFGFDLENVNDNVLIRFWHKGWSECNIHFRRSSFCWAMLLNGLKKYLENGVVIPFDERE